MTNKTLLIVAMVILVVILGYLYSRTSETSNKTNSAEPPLSTQLIPGYQGQLLAGFSSPYFVFVKADYDKAAADNKIIFLDFYANWCPICRAEEPVIEQGFDNLTTGKIVGFRANFNDNQTDDDEKALAKQFNIPYQHHKVIIKNGQEVVRDLNQWDAQTFTKTINSVLTD